MGEERIVVAGQVEGRFITLVPASGVIRKVRWVGAAAASEVESESSDARQTVRGLVARPKEAYGR
jgi:hypothetical protein